MLMGGKTAGPVLKESTLKLYDLIERYNNDDMHGVTLDTAANGDIFLAYDTIFSYTMNQINFDFTKFAGQMELGIDKLLENTPIDKILTNLPEELQKEWETKPITLTPEITNTAEMSYTLDIDDQFNIDGLKEKQILQRIDFLNTDIIIKIKPTFAIKTDRLLNLEITMPFIDTPIKVNLKKGEADIEQPFTITSDKQFSLNAKGNEFKFKFILTGDDATKVKMGDNIACDIELKIKEESKYVAYGWFNYTYNDNFKADTLVASLNDYIPKADETILRILDPQCIFEVHTTLGVPLEFGLDTIYSDSPNGNKTFINHDFFSIDRAQNYRDTAITKVAPIDNTYFKERDPDVSFSDFIRSDMDALRFSYHFVAQKLDLNNMDKDKVPVQFIPSDAKLDIHGKLRVPLAFDTGSILCYQDTIELDMDTESLKDVSRVELYFNYTNHLPIGFYLDLYLLDESYQNILKDENQLERDTAYQTINIEKTPVYTTGDRKGIVDESKLNSGKFTLTFTKDTDTSITQIQKAKYMLFKYRSIKEGVSGEAIRMKASDYLSLSVNFFIDGKIIISNE
jgi:hypothetical protein